MTNTCDLCRDGRNGGPRDNRRAFGGILKANRRCRPSHDAGWRMPRVDGVDRGIPNGLLLEEIEIEISVTVLGPVHTGDRVV